MPIFDRFVRYEWAERALETAVKREDASKLRDWITKQNLKEESAKRTYNILSHLWISSPSSSEKLRVRENALLLFPSVDSKERLVLHWGISLLQFPIFHETSQVVGKLGKLQKEFHKSEIIDRVLEKHSNQTTIRRAVERVLQTMKDWSVLEEESKGLYSLKGFFYIQSTFLAEWLLYALLSINTEKYWLVNDLFQAPEIFPFASSSFRMPLGKSDIFTIERNSFGEELIGINFLEVT